MQPQEASDLSAAWSKLFQLTSTLLLINDGSISRAEHFAKFARGDLEPLITNILKYAGKQAKRKQVKPTWEGLRVNASRVARTTGGCGKAARMLRVGPDAASPRTPATLKVLQQKHPHGDAPDELRAAQDQGWAILRAARIASTAEPASMLPKVFTSDEIRLSIMTANPGSSPGLSGLSILHLQQALRYGGGLGPTLLASLAWLGTALYAEEERLPAIFWYFHSAAQLTALGEKVRPIACGDTLRRVFGRTYCRLNAQRFAQRLQAGGQYGVGVAGGVEIIATMARLIYEAEGTTLSIDCVNAFNSLKRSAIFPEVAAHAGDCYAYATRLIGAERQPVLLFGLDGEAEPAVIMSAQGVQQGDPLGPLLFALALQPVLLAFRQEHPSLALPAYLDDLMLMALSGNSLRNELSASSQGFQWLQDHLENRLGLQVNLGKTHLLVPENGILGAGEAAEQVVCDTFGAIIRPTDCIGDATAGEQVLRVTGVPIGCRTKVQQAATDVLRAPETELLVREIARSRDTHMAYTLLRVCLIPRASFLARNLGPTDLTDELQRFDAMTMAALAAVTQEPLAMESGNVNTAEGELLAHSPACDWDAAIATIRAEDWDGAAPVAMSSVAQTQASLPLSFGGLGIRSMAVHNGPAFLARTAASLPPAMLAFPDTMHWRLRDSFQELPLVADLRAAYHDLIGRGVDEEKVISMLPAGWAAMATTGDCALLLNAIRRSPGVLEALPAGPAALPPPEADADADPAAQLALTDPVEPEVRHLQKALSKLLDQTRMAALPEQVRATAEGGATADATRATLARLLSQQGRGAMAAFSVFPSNSRKFTMSDPSMRESLRRNLGIERSPLVGSQCCSSCPAQQSGAHARSCARTGEQNYRHATLRDGFIDCIKADAGFIAARESTECFNLTVLAARIAEANARNGKTPAMDIVVSPGALDMPQPRDRSGQLVGNLEPAQYQNKGAAIDVTIVDPTCSSYRRAAADKAKHALMLKVKEKFIHYFDSGLLDRTRFTLIPLAVEQFGSMSPHADDFIKAAARHQSARSGGAWSESRCVQRWRQRLSIIVQEGISASVARMWARTVAVAGEPFPDLDGYTRVHLLLRHSEVQPPAGALPEPAAVPPGPHASGGMCAPTETTEVGQLAPHSTAVTPQGGADSLPHRSFLHISQAATGTQ